MTATPSPSGVVRELVPRVARVVRPTARTGFWGNGRGFPALSPRSLTGSRARARIKRAQREQKARRINNSLGLAHCTLGLARGSKGTRNPTGTTSRPEPEDEPRTLLVRPFCSAGLRPSLRPVLSSTPLRGVSRKVSKGGVPPPWPRHTAHPPIGSELRHPSPFSPSATTIRLKIPAGEIRAGDVLPRPRGSLCCSDPASFTRPVEIMAARCIQEGVRKVESGEDGGGECVEGGVVV